MIPDKTQQDKRIDKDVARIEKIIKRLEERAELLSSHDKAKNILGVVYNDQERIERLQWIHATIKGWERKLKNAQTYQLFPDEQLKMGDDR